MSILLQYNNITTGLCNISYLEYYILNNNKIIYITKVLLWFIINFFNIHLFLVINILFLSFFYILLLYFYL